MRDIYIENLSLRLEKVDSEIKEILCDLENYKKEETKENTESKKCLRKKSF